MNAKNTQFLEVLSAEPHKPNQVTAPLLFIHGAYSGAWIWQEHFLPWFAKQGYSAHALSLTGHGDSPGQDRLDWLSIEDYVQDVLDVAAGFAEPPILIGHSMGGFIAQRAMSRLESPACVLMASVPPHGLWGSSLSLAIGNPQLAWSLNRLMGGGSPPPEALKSALFYQDIPSAQMDAYYQRMQAESSRAIVDMTFTLPSRPRNTPPLLVMGAAEDALISPREVERTARFYNVEACILPEMGHGLMLEKNWQTAAKTIDAWLGQQAI